MPGTGTLQIYVAKGTRVFYSGLLSILIPSYLLALGYGGLYLGLVLVVILASNVFSNLALTYLENRWGRRHLLQIFSVLIIGSGALLASSSSIPIILLGSFLGNISTTGTEAGPFQSIEAGVLPELGGGSAVESFGRYNLVGYAASALGAFFGGSPDWIPGGMLVYRLLFAGFAIVGGILLIVYTSLHTDRFEARGALATEPLTENSRRELTRLSGLFSIDAFGGSFVSQYVLSSWFLLTYGTSRETVGSIFFVTNIIVVFSVYGAAKIAEILGDLRTMVYTHLVSNAFLIAIPLAGSLPGALSLLFLRQAFSQMDVPTRQALMSEIFQDKERVRAFAVSNTARSVSAFAGGPVNTAFLASGFLSGLLFTGGLSKIAYDLLIYASYRKRYK